MFRNHLCLGFEGLDMNPELKDFLTHFRPRSLIVFSRNWDSPEQFKNLVVQIRVLYKRNKLKNPFIAVDQEGGEVQRFRSGFMDFPSFFELGQKYENDGDIDYIYNLSKKKGLMLKNLGIDINFSPVLDVARNKKNPIIYKTKRSFSKMENVVALLALSYSKGLIDAGVLPCGKHFPGHGGTDKDSHLELPVVLDYPEKMFLDLLPFAAFINHGFKMLMSSHVLYKSIDSQNPATLSKVINKGLLRDVLGFKGVLVSDDLCMKALYSRALAKKNDVNNLFFDALEAGNDMVLVCHQEYIEKLDLDYLEKNIGGKFKKSQQRIEDLGNQFSDSGF